MKFEIYLLLILALLTGHAFGEASVTGGWNVVGNAEGSSSEMSGVYSCGSDPSITLGITSTSSIFGTGIFSDLKTGSQDVQITVGGYDLSVSYDGDVSSNASLSGPGSVSSSAFVGASATGISTGGASHDIFGSADVITDGYLSGIGTAGATAEGSVRYGVIKIGTPSEVWGQISGKSSLKMEGHSSDALASTGGADNGLHTDSRATQDISGMQSSTSTSQITSYLSVVNEANVTAASAGMAQGGAWDPSSITTKQRLINENAASSVTGTLTGYVESNGLGDAADVSAILQSKATKDASDLAVSGGPATYATATQSSQAQRTYSETRVKNSVWGSVARGLGTKATQYGNLSEIASGAHTYEPNAYALSFGNILMKTDYTLEGSLSSSKGNMSLDTYAEASKGKVAFAGSIIGPIGQGNMFSADTAMVNSASFIGGISPYLDLFHFSYIQAGSTPPWAETHNIIGWMNVSSPGGIEFIIQPAKINTSQDPNIAWSRTEGYYARTL
jgi:hypothetical protein